MTDQTEQATGDDRPSAGPRTSVGRRIYLLVELLAVFVVLPGALAWRPWQALLPGLRFPLIPMIWLITAFCFLWLWRQRDFDRRRFGLGPNHNFRQYLPGVLLRFAILGSLLTLLVYLVAPAGVWLNFPRRRTGLWLIIMCAYPVLSVYPQGIVWRAFICRRYRTLIPHTLIMLVVASLLFSFGHIVLRNPWALLLTFPGGLLFTRTYQRTGSLLLAGIEHALYGDLAFTIGLGHYLYGRI